MKIEMEEHWRGLISDLDKPTCKTCAHYIILGEVVNFPSVKSYTNFYECCSNPRFNASIDDDGDPPTMLISLCCEKRNYLGGCANGKHWEAKKDDS